MPRKLDWICEIISPSNSRNDTIKKKRTYHQRQVGHYWLLDPINETLSVLDRQIKGGLDLVSAEQVVDLVIAYEPVWAIGTGRTATASQAQEAHAHIRTRLKQWFGGDAAERCHVIYGGSVKPDNIREIVMEPDVDGALVGGASLDVSSFRDIVVRSRQAAV